MTLRVSEHLARGMFLRKPDDGTGAPPVVPGAPPAAPPAAPVPPWGSDVGKTWMVGDKPWYDVYVPEGPTRELMKVKNYANPAVVGDSYYALNKSFQENPNRVELPAADAKPEVLDAFYKKLGRPDAAEQYDFAFGADVQVDDRFVKFGKGIAHKLGLNQKQAQLMGKEWNGFVGGLNTENATKEAQENDNALQTLKTQIGEKFEPWRANGQRVMDALKQNSKNPDLRLTDEDFGKVEKAIGAAPLAKFLAAIGSLSGEAGFVANANGGGAPGTPEGMTGEQAKAEIAKKQSDAAFMKQYETAADPGHAAAVDLMNRLYARSGAK